LPPAFWRRPGIRRNNKMRTSDNEFARDPAHDRPHCPCGALIAEGLLRCRKCRARARFNWRRRHAPVTRRNGRSGTGPANREPGK
jgi:hypothetical protein